MSINNLWKILFKNFLNFVLVEPTPSPSYGDQSVKHIEGRSKLSGQMMSPRQSGQSHEDHSELPFLSPDEETAFGDSSILGAKGMSTKDLFPNPDQIDQCKKLHLVLCSKSEDSEASSLKKTHSKPSLGGTLHTAQPLREGIHFFCPWVGTCLNVLTSRTAM